MRKQFARVVLWLFLLGGSVAYAQSGMTDSQVIEYVQQALQEGKDQQTIAMELLSKGASQEQLLRLKSKYSGSSASDVSSSAGQSGAALDTSTRVRKTTSPNAPDSQNGETTEDAGVWTDSMKESMKKHQALKVSSVDENDVFGRNIFNIERLTFQPNLSMATPENYRLGAGDEVIVDVWGSSQNTMRLEISPDGYVNIENLGPVYLNNMTIKDARHLLKQELGKIYADSGNNIQVTLGNIRTIQVNVMGEVMAPGTYALSSLSTVFHALYASGGVSHIGSLRNVQVARSGKTIARLDVYEYIMKGKIQDDIRLQDGDVVIVPTYDELVKITGKVKRPMFYEMKNGESAATLLKYAGGFSSDAYKKTIRVLRKDGKEFSVKTVNDIDYSAFKLTDGDVVTVDSILNRFNNRLEVKGAVYHPGVFELSGSLNTVRQLVEKADGLLGDAFTGRAVLYRERENLTKEVLPVDIEGILKGTSPDIALQKNDILYIPSIHDLQDMGKVTISGEVNKPGSYTYADHMSLEDLVITAGGLKESASLVRVDVSRRIRDPKGTTEPDVIGQNFSFGLKDGFVVDGEAGFELQPYDQVFVRRSPSYNEQVNVTVEGEVLYRGDYTLNTKSERLSSLIQRAGGVSRYAYVRGAKLRRLANEEELRRMEDVVEMVRREIGDAMAASLGLEVDSTFTVGIDLEAALANPGGDADLVLREGDVLMVPEYNNTVKVNGAVMMPNTVSYAKGKSVKYYLGQAGGYSANAKKSQKFIIYMNGQVAKVKGSGKKQIEPGCEIVVPNKTKKFNFANVVSNATSFASLATMLASLATMMK
ncbi:SLBB domain-containing protein [Phocaeicola sp.]|uniref:SLBB domain-containing protein n=1 Tax=Phocaeicola sp. TaxID=2773926 RepID=UPI003A920B78